MAEQQEFADSPLMYAPHLCLSCSMYVVAQYALHCGFELAHQRGLLRTPRQQQQPGQPHAVPCSPTGAAAPVCAAGDKQTPHTSCRTPVSQLRAEQQQQQLEDCSPCNNIVRRLAADIQEGSPALRLTLQGLARRSTGSLRSRTSTHSDGNQQERTTPLASPGRAWTQPPASCALEPLVFDLQGASTNTVPSPAAAGPEQLPAPSAHKQLGTEDSDDGCQPEDDSMRPLQGLVRGAVPSLLFKGFGIAGRAHEQATLASTASAELCTPRLEPCWPSLHSNASSSNGTAVSSKYSHFSSGGGSWGAATVQHSHAAAAPGTANWAANAYTNERAAAAACGSAKAGGVSADSAAQSRSRAEASTAGSESCTGSSVGTDYSSCHDDDEDGDKQDEEEVFDCAAAGEPLCTPRPAARAFTETAGQPCQLPLSPQLLKQLTASLQEANKPDPPLPEDDAISGCDWATVCSYEEYE